MSVLKSENGKELLVDCYCGCCEGFRFRFDIDDDDQYCYMSVVNGAFYRDQGDTFLGILRKKLKKIWSIIRNKDYHYAEIVMSKTDYEIFRRHINEADPNPYKSEITYICDEKACPKGCLNSDCHHTTDITHAKNFKKIDVNKWMEDIQ